MTITVITSSDRAFRQEYQDLSGTSICQLLKEYNPQYKIRYFLVPDEEEKIYSTIIQNLDSSWVITTGGTGISPRDIMPDICEKICDRPILGISEYLRLESLKQTPFAIFSRVYTGQKDKCIIVNLPGSQKGAEFCTKLLLPLLEHGTRMILGQGH